MSNDFGVKNNVLVDVYNADGSLANHVEGHNFISLNMKKLAEWMLRDYVCNFKSYSTNFSYCSLMGTVSTGLMKNWLNIMYLSDNNSAESPLTEVAYTGLATGYAYLDTPFAQVGGARGSVSTTLSKAREDFAKFVCEWNESTGNGTFQSVYLANPDMRFFLDVNPNASITFRYTCICIYDENHYLVSKDTTGKIIYKVDRVTLEEVESYDLSGLDNDIRALIVHDDIVYITTKGGAFIYKYDLNTDILTNLLTNSRAYALCIYNGELLSFGYYNTSAMVVSRYTLAGVHIQTYYITGGTSVASPLSVVNIDGILYCLTSNHNIVELTNFPANLVFSTTLTREIMPNMYAMDYDPVTNEYVFACLYYTFTYDQSGLTASSIMKMKKDQPNNIMFSRVLLPAPVTKLQGQTLKVTYTVSFD